jgi:hypothetical protein
MEYGALYYIVVTLGAFRLVELIMRFVEWLDNPKR